MSRGGRPALAGILLVIFAAPPARSQEPRAESRAESGPSIDRIAEKANHTSPYLSAQGLKALKAQGAGAVPALERFVARRTILALAPLVVDWLGESPDDGARKLLRQALEHRGFPWRPQAARALALSPRSSELDVFLGLAQDGLSAVREPALLALGEIGSKDSSLRLRILPELERATSDPMFEPRLAACEALVRIGEKPPALLLQALGVERRFFDLDFGVLARRRAWAVLKPIVGEGTGYDPVLGPDRNADALREVARRLGPPASTSGPPSSAGLAASAPASRPTGFGGDVENVIFGLEVRSCRSGDQWVRLTSDGELVLGNYDLEKRKLDAKTAAALRKQLRELTAPANPESRPAPDSFFGRPGCDFEKWYLPDEAGLLRLSVGLAGRPEALQALHKALEDVVESAFGAALGQQFADRTAPFTKPDEGED